MFHAPKRPCSYGGIIYSFFRICQHIFLNLFLITDSVPIIKHFSVSDGLTVVLPFQGVKTVLNFNKLRKNYFTNLKKWNIVVPYFFSAVNTYEQLILRKNKFHSDGMN